MTATNHFIDNQWIRGVGKEFAVRNPGTDEITWQGRAATETEVDSAVESAEAAFEPWSRRPLSDRKVFLEAFGRQLSDSQPELAELISRTTGKPRWESLSEVELMITKIRDSIEAYEERCRVVKKDIGGARATVRFKPHGVMAVLGPFNLPGHLPNGHIIPALVAGNTVVLKPSRQVAPVGWKMMELWQATGIPAGVINMVQGGQNTGTDLVRHSKVNGVMFTGSSQTGQFIHYVLRRHPDKILALEMGGNNPLVVHEVSDLDAAAKITAFSAFITAGQRCTCTRRLIVPYGPQGDDFINRLCAITKKLRVGLYTDDPEPFMGPVISETKALDLWVIYGALHADGGRMLVELELSQENRRLVTPGIIDVTEVRRRSDEELFGPLLQVVRVPDFEHAIDEANRTAYGLAAALLSDNETRYEEFFRRVRAGVINWNLQTTGASGKLPFGGIRASGNHRPSGYYAADYCSYPVASLENDHLVVPAQMLRMMDKSAT